MGGKQRLESITYRRSREYSVVCIRFLRLSDTHPGTGDKNEKERKKKKLARISLCESIALSHLS